MKRIRKFLIRSFALAMLAMLVVGGVLGGFGYKMYRDALAEQPLEEKVAEIRADPDYTTLAEIPEIYLDVVVAVEDHRFEQHFGIDLIITQQLAKNLYFTQEKSFIRKIAEMFMAFRLENTYTKDEILELYVNSIYFGDGYYCIYDASQGYFGKAPIDMTDYECTLLAGIPNAPSVYSLTANPELAEQRQEYVVQRMVQYGYISEDEAQSILQDQS